ncbi:MAG: OmpA family protein [Flavobacteriales bacterium]|nr:OmpA family protein [Flavobacteriales bacterium]
MQKLIISILFSTTFVSVVWAQSFPVEVDLRFEEGQMAIDGDELKAEFEKKQMAAYRGEHLRIQLKAYSDCPIHEGKRMKIAAERAAYCENFLKAYFDQTTIELNTELFIRENCENSTADPSWCHVVIVLDGQQSAAPEPIPAPEPDPVPIDTTQLPTSLNELSQLNVGESLVLEGLNFQPGKHRILNEAKPVLKKLLTIMQENPTLQIEIQGHICCGKKGGEDGIDDETKKYNLSWTRAQFVYDYLIDHGIDKTRLSFKGYAMSQPLVYPEKTIQDQIKNRRVEVLITGK